MTLRARVELERAGFRLAVSLEVAAGETLAVLGPNGAGKTTLIEALVGLCPLSGGEVALGQQILESPARGLRLAPGARGAGVAFQQRHLFPHLSVIDNVVYGRRARGERREVAHRHGRRWLERFELEELEQRRPETLSGGEAQRVSIARALACEPSWLLLDEPLAALDVERRGRFLRCLESELAGFAGPRLVVTHDLLVAAALCERALVIEDGRTSQSGPIELLRRRPATAYVAKLVGVNFLSGVLRADGRGRWLEVGARRFDLDPSASFGGDAPEACVGTPTRAQVDPRRLSVDAKAPAPTLNTLAATVSSARLEGDRLTLELSGSPELCAEVALGGRELRDFAPGREVWVSVPPDAIQVYAPEGHGTAGSATLARSMPAGEA